MAGIRVYCGVIRILGSQLKPDGTYHPCYAPKQSSALKIEPIVDTSVKRLSLSRLPHIADKKEELEAERLARDLASQFPIVAVFQALQIDYTNLDCFVDAPLGFQFIGQSNTEEIDRFVAFNPGRKLEFLTSWSDVSAKMTTKRLKIGRIMIAGAKGVGKSTFGRYLINQLLQVTPVLAYLDTDVGQPEFTAPGMISLQLITQPLLGPGHTHMKQPFRSYHYGYISCKSDPQKFMSLVRLAMADYTSKWSSSIPLIVNTDGWIKGMGLDILSSSVHSVQPTDLIQIEGITAATTLDLVVPENVQVHRIDAWTESTGASSSKFDRHCRLRSYFLAQEELGENASLIASNPDRMNLCTSIELSRLVPHEISFKRLRIHFPGHTVPYHELLNALNGSVVGLCISSVLPTGDSTGPSIVLQDPMSPCLGLGIVRGINCQEELIYLVTPMALELLQHVNLFIKSQQELPVEFLEQPSILVPAYCSTTNALDGKGTGASVMQSRNNLKRKYL